MADCNQMDRLKEFLRYYDNCTIQEIPALYDGWSKDYNQDMDTLNYKVPKTVATLLREKISGNPDEVLVLDVACGTGKIAKQLFDLGFRKFVGVDGSKGMLEQAAKTGLYQELKLAMLGAEPLPAQKDMFDVVVIASALDNFCAPVSVIRELCGATKPGGLVCMARGDYAITSETIRYDKEFESERQLMEEEEGLWKLLDIKHLDSYMTDLQTNPVSKVVEERNITGNVYLYQKSTN
ncbi:methyltransferase-like protein 27 [Takifugu rubripes]|uniref:Methyltransferase-like protein 27 n=1 Tax=Takifugu rubripes TaxID=31033 RepID=H2T3N8_TAKRU|nr:methyltransferase-like protein 27 [Takifugu rubripes]XP_029701458.1 methyltransferase-like protein 27 [Takifugu rubripes]